MSYDDIERNPYAQQSAGQLIHRMTIREELVATIKHLEDQTDKKKKLLELLDANPAIEQFHDLMRS